ncbi:hypothetical protein [Sulfuracidifex tepidarius]|uniref:TRASH domain-containing protein n=1 Tax=Sulfuracidifex tepidarius TaxID=1294262 RepID=A0A510E2B4_9CREN|nr:hypothetical protein [Sulfuracidifex tepidarius]BBG23881.1 hypothetical protein IC006_1177 [Sulfuracidifex tepidarius]BBG26636.1 hypothetical protein IC007_1152 [Sulfuracidifex tepidarius]
MANYFECNTCGRPFKEGQGIILTLAGKKLFFHSKGCAYKFFKEVLELSDKDCIDDGVEEVLKKYEEVIETKRKKAEKKI